MESVSARSRNEAAVATQGAGADVVGMPLEYANLTACGELVEGFTCRDNFIELPPFSVCLFQGIGLRVFGVPPCQTNHALLSNLVRRRKRAVRATLRPPPVPQVCRCQLVDQCACGAYIGACALGESTASNVAQNR